MSSTTGSSIARMLVEDGGTLLLDVCSACQVVAGRRVGPQKSTKSTYMKKKEFVLFVPSLWL
jgi:hypothetical protein